MDRVKLKADIESGHESRFYASDEWRDLRMNVIKFDNYRCTRCGKIFRGKLNKVIVHHVEHLKDRPDLATSIYNPDTGERQLVTLCGKCHVLVHPEKMTATFQKKEMLTTERWD